MLTPILLSATSSIATSQKVELSTTDLQNPFRTAMLLDEIRIISDASVPLQARFHLGREPLTSDFIPVGNLGRFLNPQAGFPGINTWKLPKPLYIPATEFVVPTIFNQPLTGSVTTEVTVQYAGRSLPSNAPPPEVIHMPWVTMWRTLQAGDQSVTLESTEADLRNPFNEEMKIQRFIGRVYVNQVENTGLLTRRDILVRVTDSAGRFLVRDPTPLADLFFINERAWDVNAMLRPKGFYIVNLLGDYDDFSSSDRISTVISCVGYRDVYLNS